MEAGVMTFVTRCTENPHTSSDRFIEHVHEGFLVLRYELKQRRIRLSDLLQQGVEKLRVGPNNLPHLLELGLSPKK